VFGTGVEAAGFVEASDLGLAGHQQDLVAASIPGMGEEGVTQHDKAVSAAAILCMGHDVLDHAVRLRATRQVRDDVKDAGRAGRNVGFQQKGCHARCRQNARKRFVGPGRV
tara:strand:- start:6088 stop:6420 length:333 start_codon:yes stop_codon:yes gene_type:complete